MKEKIVVLEEVCGKNIYTRGDGHVLYGKIAEALHSHDRVIVDFNEKEIASESFLDEAIVEHYIRPLKDNLAKRLVLHRVTKPDQALIRKIYDYRKRLEEKERIREIKKAV